MKATDASDFLQSLNAGVFANQLGQALSNVAAGCVEYGKQGTVTVTFKLKQIAQSHQVNVTHTLDFVEPTKRGKRREDTTLDTPLYVTPDGLKPFLDNPTGQLFKKEDTPVPART
jgi:hypothetical protein